MYAIIAAVLLAFIGLLVWTYFGARADDEADRMRDALWPDPARTAGGAAGKSYSGGFDAYGYYIPPEPDHHTLEEYEAIARGEQGDEIVREEQLL